MDFFLTAWVYRRCKDRNLNSLKPSGHYMYRTVVTICTTSLTLTNPLSAHTAVFMCFVWISEQTAIISLHNINWLVFITETECVYCAVGTRYSDLSLINFASHSPAMRFVRTNGYTRKSTPIVLRWLALGRSSRTDSDVCTNYRPTHTTLQYNYRS
jgi:hypothetical protein